MAEPITLPVGRKTPLEPPEELRRLRETAPMSRLAFPDGHVGWLVTRHATARAVLADRRFSARRELRHFPVTGGTRRRLDEPSPPGMFISADPPNHTRYRRLLTGQFTVNRMRRLTPRIEEIVRARLDAMAQAGPPVDLVAEYALPIPSQVICELLGVPYADRDTFQRNTRVLLSLTATGQEAEAAAGEIRAYIRTLVRAKQVQPTDDILGRLVAAGGLTEEELGNIGFLLLVAGHETTSNMLGLGTFTLLQHPDQLRALREDPSLADNTVEELLRYNSIIQFGTMRVALEDVEVDGHPVRAGETVVISIPAGNRDPERFDAPETLDVTRPASGHLSFGHGIHQCLGQQLARIEMRVGYLELFQRFPTLRLAVPADEIRTRDSGILGLDELPVTW
ncbi:MAG TPA: cytochrome P450 [Streptosporangiales bacterium]